LLISEEEGVEDDEDSGPKIDDINLTNQLIGEVQAFTYMIRWAVYQFYGF
jgi:hypothetical protein